MYLSKDADHHTECMMVQFRQFLIKRFQQELDSVLVSRGFQHLNQSSCACTCFVKEHDTRKERWPVVRLKLSNRHEAGTITTKPLSKQRGASTRSTQDRTRCNAPKDCRGLTESIKNDSEEEATLSRDTNSHSNSDASFLPRALVLRVVGKVG